ncbi:MAG TPA: altronate dehydratase family protein [Caulobacteraceae bacterium]|nr:altronate dehydratase family protein [Caulobacteraceae bacterium]
MSVTDDLEVRAVRLNPADNVVVAPRRIPAGARVAGEVAAAEAIPSGHKMATRSIRSGEAVLKYGQVIGQATADIAPGAHVHTHNLAVSDLRQAASPRPAPVRQERPRTFMGYRRADGRVGVRNHVAILTSVNCSATVARLIADEAERSGLLRAFPNVDGIVPVTHASGCGMASAGEGFDLLRRTLWGTAANPNFGAVLLVGLGCEVVQVGRFAKDYGLAGRPEFQALTIQEAGGTRAAVEQGLARLAELLPLANAATRTEVPAGELVLGLQCGGSDAWSGVTSNPALGDAADRLVALGGTVILSETPEIYGAEHLLLARATPEVGDKLKARIAWWEAYTARHGATMDNNPSPGNKAGGLTTILEKSLGAVAKAGASPLADVIEYAEPLKRRGLVFMDSPGFDPCSATGQVASGATMIAFTTGRGSAFGCKPSPSIKLSSNSEIFRRMEGDIDLDCGPIAEGAATVAETGEAILDYLLQVASGRPSKSEALGYGLSEFVPWIIGATM